MIRTIIMSILTVLSISLYAQNNTILSDQDQRARYDQVQEAKIAFISTALELSQKEADQFWPLYNKYWEGMESINKKRQACLKGFNKYLKEGNNYKEEDLRYLLNVYISFNEKEAQIQRDYFNNISRILSTEKVARLFKAEEDFRIKMIMMLKDQSKSK